MLKKAYEWGGTPIVMAMRFTLSHQLSMSENNFFSTVVRRRGIEFTALDVQTYAAKSRICKKRPIHHHLPCWNLGCRSQTGNNLQPINWNLSLGSPYQSFD